MRRVLILAAVLAVAAAAATVVYQVTRDRDYRTQLTRGDTALRLDQSTTAIEAYSGAVALRPDSMLARLRRGEAAFHAHDRATLGGMLISNGLAVWLAAQWGFRAGARWLWIALAWSGNLAFAERNRPPRLIVSARPDC